MNLTSRCGLARLLVSLAVAGGVVFGVATPASAVTVQTDHPKLTSKGFDLGENWDTFGALNGGDLVWDLTNGVIPPD